MISFPWHPRSPYPWSSVITMITLGRESCAWQCSTGSSKYIALQMNIVFNLPGIDDIFTIVDLLISRTDRTYPPFYIAISPIHLSSLRPSVHILSYQPNQSSLEDLP